MPYGGLSFLMCFCQWLTHLLPKPSFKLFCIGYLLLVEPPAPA
jgi:hypothetical protein